MPAEPIVLTASTELATDTTAELCHGSEHGVDVSFFLNHTAPGRGTGAHRHPYPEVFIVHDGEATFSVDDGTLTARSGRVVIVPAGATHAVDNAGTSTLEMTRASTPPTRSRPNGSTNRDPARGLASRPSGTGASHDRCRHR